VSEPVKSRRYESPLRDRRAKETRKAILDAALSLFLGRGYVGTPLNQIAAEAGVSLATVKLVFGTKTDLLLALWHRTLAGGEDNPAPVIQRSWFQEVVDAHDPVTKLRLNARNSVMVKQRIASLLYIIETAAPTDPAIAELWSVMQREFHTTQGTIVEALHLAGHLRPELTVDEGTDILWTLNHPRTYLLLVNERGWTPERYERWLADATRRELLPDQQISAGRTSPAPG
jgi:AcrR family transcriptional regulator